MHFPRTLADLRHEHESSCTTHLLLGHPDPVPYCTRCNPAARLFWDDDCHIITLDTIAQNLAEAYPDDAPDIAALVDYADDCATTRGALDEVIPLPINLHLNPGDEVLAATNVPGIYDPVTIDEACRVGSLSGPTYALLERDAIHS